MVTNTIYKGLITVGSDGFFRIDGKPFFPIGLDITCYDNPFPSMTDLKARGFNTVFDWHSLREDQGNPRGSIPELGTNLTLAENAGLMVVVCEALISTYKIIPPETTPYCNRYGGYQNYITQVYNAYKDRNNILAWYVSDEPNNQTLVDYLILGCNLAHSIDTKHPTLLNFSWTALWNSRDWTPYADVGLISGYPVVDIEENVHLDNVEKYVGYAKTLVDAGKPYGDWLQAYGSTEGHRYPTYAEERCMTFLAIVSGAKLIPYWLQWSLITAQMKADLTAVVQEVNAYIPVILSTEVAKPTVSNSAVRVMAKIYNGETYIFAVNPMKTFNGLLTFNLAPLFSAPPSDVEVLGENRTIPFVGTAFTDSFNYTNVHIYKISALPDGYTVCGGLDDVVTRTSVSCPTTVKTNDAFTVSALVEYQAPNGVWLPLVDATVNIYKQIGSGTNTLVKTGVTDSYGVVAFTDVASSTPATVKYSASFGGGSYAVYMSYSIVNQMVQ